MLSAVLLALALCALGAVLLLYRPRLKPLWFLTALITAVAACALAAAGARQGLLVARYAEEPGETVDRFLSALDREDWSEARACLGSDRALGLEAEAGNGDAAEAELLAALRGSTLFYSTGELELRGLDAAAELGYTTLDLAALLRDAGPIVRSRLEQIVAERPYREVYDENGAYRAEITEELWLEAVRDRLAAREDYRREGSLRLSLSYDGARWRILPDETLFAALGGAPGKLSAEIHNGKSSALDGLVFIRKRYSIPETALAAPAPDPAGFGRSADPADVRAVIDGAAILLDGQRTVWNEDVELFPGTDFSWYYDDSILAICWKEMIEGKCCTFAEVRIADASQLRRKVTDDVYDSRRREYASRLAEEARAVVASNGDFYAFRPYGITVYQRRLYRCDTAHLDTCFFTANGDMLLCDRGSFRSREEVEAYVRDYDVLFSLAFGPILIRAGELLPVGDYLVGEVFQDYSRSILGMTGELHYLLMTVNFDVGVYNTTTLAHAARIMYEKGCRDAYALDGGQTAELWMDGRILNHIDWGAERPVSDILYFGSAVSQEGREP